MACDSWGIKISVIGLGQLLLLSVLLTSPAAAQWDPATGYIRAMPGAGFPVFDPAPWNSAYKVTFRNVPLNGTFGGSRVSWPYAPDSAVNTPQDCFSEGFDSASAENASVGACSYKNTTGDTFDFWVKKSGSAFSEANCYCYALNRFEGESCQPGFSQPGFGRTRSQYEERITCDIIAKAVIDDGAVPINRQEALPGQPTQGHYIVVMARPDGTCVPGHCTESEFHAMRKDASGTWSWKLPSMPATDKDLEGKPITDPEAAPLPGHYLACGYFRVEPVKMYLESHSIFQERPPGPLAPGDMYNVLRFKDSSVQVTVSPLPYNPDRDAEVEPTVKLITAEDLAWERQRGTLKYKQWRAKLAKALELGTPEGSDAG